MDDGSLRTRKNKELNSIFLHELELCVIEKKCIDNHICGYYVLLSTENEYQNKLLLKPEAVHLSTEYFRLCLN